MNQKVNQYLQTEQCGQVQLSIVEYHLLNLVIFCVIGVTVLWNVSLTIPQSSFINMTTTTTVFLNNKI